MDDRDEPDFQGAVEGVAGLFDLASKAVKGEDPKTREVAKDIDGDSVGEAVEGVLGGASGGRKREVREEDVEMKAPTFVTDDTEEGVEVVVDVGHTDVDPKDVVAHHKGNEATVAAAAAEGWSKTIEVKEDGPIENMEREINEEGQMVTVSISLAQVSGEEEKEEEPEDDGPIKVGETEEPEDDSEEREVGAEETEEEEGE